jgi:hypothetical protein
MSIKGTSFNKVKKIKMIASYLILLNYCLGSPLIGSATVYPTSVCGPENNNQICDNGNCCSQYGHCGSSIEYCETGCQSKFGTCTANVADPNKFGIPNPWPKPATEKPILPAIYNSVTDKNAVLSRPGSLTWYKFNGGPAYCDGKTRNEDDLVVALYTDLLKLYDCRKEQRSVRIKAPNGNSVVAQVVDMCDALDGCIPGTVDGTQGVWNALGLNLDIGRIGVNWDFI